MGLITKEEVVVVPFPVYELGGRDVCPIDVCSIDGGIAVTTSQKFTPICPLCHEPVLLETCKADEQGRAVHENCYTLKIALLQAPQQPLES